MHEQQRQQAPRFPARLILGSPVHCLAFGFGAGLSRVGPGTVGTLPGVLLFLLLMPMSVAWFLGALLVLSLFGIWLCGRSSAQLGVHDHPGIVFDEMVGYCVTALPLLPALGWVEAPLWQGLLVAFVAFRLFDVVKPWPISWCDARVEGGLGIMIDDLLAGVMGAALTWFVMIGIDSGMRW